MAKQAEIPVYLFVGFLESGKTKFIQETLEDERFDSGEKTLLLVCEEGEEEYDPDRFAFGGVSVEYIEDKSELTQAHLNELIQKTGSARVLIEYNGMWMLQDLADALPDNWIVYQCLGTADATTFKMYFENMRQLMLDKFASCELMVFNRAEAVDNDDDHMFIHKAVRQASLRCDIAYEFENGEVAYDEIPDPLPWDMDAPVIEIGDEDFGTWYMDCSDQPQNYAGKTVQYTAQVCQSKRAGKGCFVPGRFVMTCCVEDIQFLGFPCKFDDYASYKDREWIKITAKVNVKYHPLYKGEGPVLTALKVERCAALENDVVTFS